MKTKTWFILEVETGFIGGWYTDLSSLTKKTCFIDRKCVKEFWDKRRPGYTHMICNVDPSFEYKKGECYIRDCRLLGNALTGNSLANP